MIELHRNIANIFLLIIVCFDDVTVFIFVNLIEMLLSFIHTVQIDLSITQ